jgi:hypothetical protein
VVEPEFSFQTTTKRNTARAFEEIATVFAVEPSTTVLVCLRPGLDVIDVPKLQARAEDCPSTTKAVLTPTLSKLPAGGGFMVLKFRI